MFLSLHMLQLRVEKLRHSVGSLSSSPIFIRFVLLCEHTGRPPTGLVNQSGVLLAEAESMPQCCMTHNSCSVWSSGAELLTCRFTFTDGVCRKTRKVMHEKDTTSSYISSLIAVFTDSLTPTSNPFHKCVVEGGRIWRPTKELYD